MTNQPSEKLEPCPNPWCTSCTPPLPCGLKRDGWVVRCACGIVTFRRDTEAEARTLWNTRIGKEAATPLVNRMREVLQAAQLQLEYLDSRWPTGTTPPTIAKIEAVLRDSLLSPSIVDSGRDG